MAKPDILLDSDVVRHFLSGSLLLLLPKIYPRRLAILDIVKGELCRSRSLQCPVNNFISRCRIKELTFSNAPPTIREYATLLAAGLGEGESACMATARFSRQYIASSNLRDIKDYCLTHEINYITTMDILADAVHLKALSQDQANAFIATCLAKGHKLPTSTLGAYLTQYAATIKTGLS